MIRKKILINLLILIALLLLAVNAHAFQFTLKNETGEATRYRLWQRTSNPEAPIVIREGSIEKDNVVVLDLGEIKKPNVYLITWTVTYESYFSKPWIAFWIHENFVSMEIRFVRGEFVPGDVIIVDKGLPL